METSQSTRYTAWSALALSATALSLSLAVACDSQSSRESAISPEATGARTETKTAGTHRTAVDSKQTSQNEDRDRTNQDSQTVASAEPTPDRASEQEPKPDESENKGDSSGLEIKRLVVTHEVEDREPVEPKAIQAGGGPVFAFVELKNAAEKAGIVITFEHESGKKVGHVKLEVPGEQPRWRTWGRTRMIDKAGRWDAVVRGTDGQELGRQSFEVSQKG